MSTQYILAPYASVGLQDQILYIGFGSIQIMVANQTEFKLYLEIMNEFIAPKPLKNVLKKFNASKLTRTIIDRLRRNSLIIPAGYFDSQSRWSRQNAFFSLCGVNSTAAQLSLAGKSVAIIGCGGIGNQVSVHLATAGIGELLLCDADYVEESNLSRQILFTEQDVGQMKTSVLSTALYKRYSPLRVQCIPKEVKCPTDLNFCKGVDFVVVSADKGNVVSLVNQFCLRNRVPYINVGYVNDIAVWGPLVIAGETGCYDCNNVLASDHHEEFGHLMQSINSLYQAPSFGPVNMISAGLASRDILFYLAGMKEKVHTLNKRIGLWSHNLKFEEQLINRNPNCSTCSEIK